jgi:TolA-binding protein
VTLEREGSYAPEALLERGRILDELSKHDDAIAAWTELVDRKPAVEQRKRALLLRAQRQAKLAKFDAAILDFELYIKFDPEEKDKTTREAWLGSAECYMQTDKAKNAEHAFRKVLGAKGVDADLDEPAERAILGLAELHLRKGDALNAKKLALRVLTEVPGSTWTDAALFTTGQASEALGEPERAIGYYRKLIADHPQSAQINAAKDRLKALGAGK